MAHKAMNSRVEPDVIWGPVVAHGEQDRPRQVIDGRVDQAVGSPLDELQQTFNGKGVGEHDLDLGGGLLGGDEVGDSLAQTKSSTTVTATPARVKCVVS
jgi:hypothetical protein